MKAMPPGSPAGDTWPVLTAQNSLPSRAQGHGREQRLQVLDPIMRQFTPVPANFPVLAGFSVGSGFPGEEPWPTAPTH